jgi:hypothetical protein
LSSSLQKTYQVFWENVSPEATRVLLNKRLFGYTANSKFYIGAVQKYGCQRLGKGCISVPAWNLKPIIDIFDALNVQFKVREVVDFGEKTFIEA